jgi:hypothetical protein
MVRALSATLAATILLAGQPRAQSSELPVALQSVQHFWAILKRCQTLAPDRNAIRARDAAFDRLLDEAKAPDELWRTFVDADGRPQETRFHSAREMVYSTEFAADVKRYEAMVAVVPPSVLVQDCVQYESLVEQALARK